MMVGLIPAAGLSTRFNGMLKELLPLDKNRTLLSDCIERLAIIGCTRFVLVTSPQKLYIHMAHVSTFHPTKSIAYVLGGSDMWQSILNGLEFCTGHNVILSMPDTLPALVNKADPYPNTPIKFGIFRTNQPDRFSVLTERGFDKGKHIPSGEYSAWGMVSWKPNVTEHFLQSNYRGFDEAFNAIRNTDDVSHSYYQISRYYDFANFTSYAEYIKENS